jgi:signal transduction histidine kinase
MSALLPRSLRARLVIGALIWITIGVSAAGVFISALYGRHATALVDSEMTGHIEELASLIDVDPEGTPELYRPLSDPRFSLVGSGYSWQVSRAGKVLIKSTSASAADLPIPADALALYETLKLLMQTGSQSMVVYESLLLLEGQSEPLRLQVNIDSSVVDAVLRTFNVSLVGSLLLLAIALTGAAALQVAFGLQPMSRLRRALVAVGSGKAERLPRSFPTEVQPLVDDLNNLIEINAGMVLRARTQAGNLAHALKTPLAILTDEAYRLEGRGETQAAALILQQSQRMQREIDYQIARARAAVSRSVPGVFAPVAPAVSNIISAMRRLYSSKMLQFHVDIDERCVALCDPMDLNEMLANLIDNACKWAKNTVAIRGNVDEEAKQAVIAVVDDGPGLPAQSMEAVFQIGKRLDEQVPGSGLGLPIVRDLAELYNGQIRLEKSDQGGLKAVLRLPQAGLNAAANRS